MARKRTSKKKSLPTPKQRKLVVKPIPDLTTKVELREQMDPSPKNLAESSIDINIVDDGSTPEQKAIKEASVEANKLMKDEAILAAVKSLITFRRGYTIVYTELQNMIASKGENVNPMVEDFLVQYAMYEASKPFNEHQFMQGMIGVVMPYMAEIVDKHSAAEKQQQLDDRYVADEARRKLSIPIGFNCVLGKKDHSLERERSLILTGWRNALLWLVDRIIEEINEFMVIRFMLQAPKIKEQQSNLIRLGPNQWEGCADTQKKLALCMGTYVADKLSSQPDLLIIDDLGHTFTAGFIGRPFAANAGDAHKHLRRWCNEAGSGLIGLIPFDDQVVPDLSTPEWEQLRTFTYLRGITVQASAKDLPPNKYRIIIGNHLAIFDVDKTILDNYGHGKIILPSGII